MTLGQQILCSARGEPGALLPRCLSPPAAFGRLLQTGVSWPVTLRLMAPSRSFRLSRPSANTPPRLPPARSPAPTGKPGPDPSGTPRRRWGPGTGSPNQRRTKPKMTQVGRPPRHPPQPCWDQPRVTLAPTAPGTLSLWGSTGGCNLGCASHRGRTLLLAWHQHDLFLAQKHPNNQMCRKTLKNAALTQRHGG